MVGAPGLKSGGFRFKSCSDHKDNIEYKLLITGSEAVSLAFLYKNIFGEQGWRNGDESARFQPRVFSGFSGLPTSTKASISK